jgi:hypothetical protein
VSLHIGDAGEERIEIPLDAVTRTFAVLGQRGTGKTNAAVVMVEEMVKAGGHVAILDPVGVWYGVTHAGTGPGLEGIVIGGEHGDVPLEETGGQLVAEFVVARHYPVVVIDLKLLRKGAQLRFMADYCETLFHLNREALHQVFEEADRAAPQQTRGGDIVSSRLLGAVEDIVKLGRSRGLGATLVTQRPATLNKNVLEVCETLLIFRLMGPNDRKAVRAWVEANGDPAALKRVMDSIASLGLGQCWLYSPAWLGLLVQMKTRLRETFDSSSTPEVGQRAAEPTERAPVDLELLREAMAASIVKAAADDPKALRAEVARLRGELATVRDERTVAACNHEPIIARLTEEAAQQAEAIVLLTGERDDLLKRITRASEALGWPEGIEVESSILRSDAQRGPGTPVRATVARPPRDIPPAMSGAQKRPADGRGSTPPKAGVAARAPRVERGGQTERIIEDMTEDEARKFIQQEIRRQMEAAGRVLVVPAAEVIRHEYQRRAVERTLVKLEGWPNDDYEILRFALSQDAPTSAARFTQVAFGNSAGATIRRYSEALARLASLGAVEKAGGGGNGVPVSYRQRIREWVASELAPHAPTEDDIEETYQAVLGRIAGGAA